MAHEPKHPSVKFHYIKSNSFRVIHGDGLMGSITPSGGIFFSLFNQRAPLPDVTVQSVEGSGNLGQEVVEERVGKTGIVRELEVGVIVDVSTATAIIDWLQTQVALIKRLQADQAHPAETKKESEVKI